MGVIVQFDLATWRQLYPQFSNVNDVQVNDCFYRATDIQRNDGGGPIDDAMRALRLLNLLTAHIAQLSYGTATSPSQGTVGRIANATEGSVNVTLDYPGVTPSQAWFVQTPFGAEWWAATVAYRTMQYRAGPRRIYNPYPFRPF